MTRSNCRIPCHFDCVTENCGYAVRGTRNEINSESQTILEAGYAVRGTWNEIDSKSQTILRPIYTVRFLLTIVACDFCSARCSRHGKIVYDFYDIKLPVATIVVGF